MRVFLWRDLLYGPALHNWLKVNAQLSGHESIAGSACGSGDQRPVSRVRAEAKQTGFNKMESCGAGVVGAQLLSADSPPSSRRETLIRRFGER
jgi:hypothetical protein